MLPEQTVPSNLARLSAKTGLLIRPVDSSSLDTLFGELERYDGQERTEIFDYLIAVGLFYFVGRLNISMLAGKSD